MNNTPNATSKEVWFMTSDEFKENENSTRPPSWRERLISQGE